MNAAWKRDIAAHDEADADPQTFTDNVQKSVLLFYTEILQGGLTLIVSDLNFIYI